MIIDIFLMINCNKVAKKIKQEIRQIVDKLSCLKKCLRGKMHGAKIKYKFESLFRPTKV